MKLNRETLNKATEVILNDQLKERGINTKIYKFGVCERTIINESIYTIQITTHYHLGLYKYNGVFGEQIEKLIDIDITDGDYTIIDFATSKILNNIVNGKFDKYIDDKSESEDDFLKDILDCIKGDE